MSFLRPYHCRDIASAPSARRGRNEGRRQPIGVKLPRLRKELAAMFEESHKLEKEIVKQLEEVKV